MQMIRRYLTREERAQLYATLKRRAGDQSVAGLLARRDLAVMQLLERSGLRITEFSLISVGDALDALRTSYLFIPREHRKGRAGRKRDHSCFVTSPLAVALRMLLDVRTRMGHSNADRDAPLVCSRRGTRMSVRSYQARIGEWAKHAGLTLEVSPHWFRHTRGMDIMARSTSRDPRGMVQVALGHADIKSSGIYTLPARADVEADLAQIDGAERPRKRQLRREYEKRHGL